MFKILPVQIRSPWQRLLLNKTFQIDCCIEIIRFHPNGTKTFDCSFHYRGVGGWRLMDAGDESF